MLKVLKTENNHVEGDKKLCQIYADQKSEVTSGATVDGLGDISLLAVGSTCITSEFDVGILGSDGNWAWA